MSEAKLHIESAGDAVVVARLDRPPVNALNPAWLTEIGAAFEALDRDDGVRAVVLAGAGKTLSAGMDLKELQSFTAEDQRAMVMALNTTYGKIYGLGKPVVCAAHGAAIAGGLFFVLVSDYCVAGERAVFGLAEVRVGVRFPVGPLAIAMKERFPDAEVWGIDIGGPMVRYAHMRAVDLGVEVNFAQRLAEDTKFPDNYFDIVTSYIMHHEVTAQASRDIVAEAYRVTRPGGVYSPWDFGGSRARNLTPYRKFRRWVDHRWNAEVWRLEYASLDFPAEIAAAGFQVTEGKSGRRGFGDITGRKPA